MVIGLAAVDGKLTFKDGLDKVRGEIMDAARAAVCFSEGLARPENTFYKLEKNSLDAVFIDEPAIQQSLNDIDSALQAGFARVMNLGDLFKDFYYLFDEHLALEILMKQNNPRMLLQYYDKYLGIEGQLALGFPEEVPMGMVRIDAREVKAAMQAIPSELRRAIQEHVYKEVDALGQGIGRSLKASLEGLSARIESVEKLIETEQWVEQFQQKELPALAGQYRDMLLWLDCFAGRVRVSIEQLRQAAETREQLLEYRDKAESERQRIIGERERFEKKLGGRRQVVHGRATELQAKVDSYRHEGRMYQIEQTI